MCKNINAHGGFVAFTQSLLHNVQVFRVLKTLQRAYGGSVRQALAFLQSKIKIAMVHKTLACQYSQIDDVLHLLRQIEGQVITQDYQQTVIFRLAIPIERLGLMQDKLHTLSSGQLQLTALD